MSRTHAIKTYIETPDGSEPRFEITFKYDGERAEFLSCCQIEGSSQLGANVYCMDWLASDRGQELAAEAAYEDARG